MGTPATEVFFTMLVLFASLVGMLSVALCLNQVFGAGPLRDMGHRHRRPQFTIWQMMVAVVVAALVFLALEAGPGFERVFSMTALSLGFLVWFTRNWQREFLFLMGLRDDEFPGRHDKLIWVAVVLGLAPIGVWLFRAYRLAHWPAPAAIGEESAEEAGGAMAQPA